MNRSKHIITDSSTPNSGKTGPKSTRSNESSDLLKKEKATTDPKERARWSRIKRVYGITQEQYAELDKGHCPICLREWSDRVRPAVDHDHSKDGWVRGVVCLYCNRVRIGRFRDAELVQRIADYLRGPFKYVVPEKKKSKRKKKV